VARVEANRAACQSHADERAVMLNYEELEIDQAARCCSGAANRCAA
jgi:hypothetical protein